MWLNIIFLSNQFNCFSFKCLQLFLMNELFYYVKRVILRYWWCGIDRMKIIAEQTWSIYQSGLWLMLLKMNNLSIFNFRWSQRCLVHHLWCHYCHGVCRCNYSFSSSNYQVSFKNMFLSQFINDAIHKFFFLNEFLPCSTWEQINLLLLITIIICFMPDDVIIRLTPKEYKQRR